MRFCCYQKQQSDIDIINPSSHVDGHNEAEFGMSWCAGFGGSFYNAYFEVHSSSFLFSGFN